MDNPDFFSHLSYSQLTAHAVWLTQQPFYQNDRIYNIVTDRLAKALHIGRLLQQQAQLVAAEHMYLQTLIGYEKALGPGIHLHPRHSRQP